MTDNIKRNNIYNMDCLEGMRQLPDDSVDCIVTDPPYGVNFKANECFNDSKERVESDARKWLKEMYRVLKPGCHCYIFIPTKEVALWIAEINDTFTLNNIVATRCYNNTTYLKSNFQFNAQLIAYCSKGAPKKFNEVDLIKTSEAWFKDKRNKNPKEYTYSYPAFFSQLFANTQANKKRPDRHPCEKNPELIEFFIKISTDENDIVLEPFVGGGSTILAAVNCNRQYIGFELSEEYYNTANKNIEEKKKVLEKKNKKN